MNIFNSLKHKSKRSVQAIIQAEKEKREITEDKVSMLAEYVERSADSIRQQMALIYGVAPDSVGLELRNIIGPGGIRRAIITLSPRMVVELTVSALDNNYTRPFAWTVLVKNDQDNAPGDWVKSGNWLWNIENLSSRCEEAIADWLSTNTQFIKAE